MLYNYSINYCSMAITKISPLQSCYSQFFFSFRVPALDVIVCMSVEDLAPPIILEQLHQLVAINIPSVTIHEHEFQSTSSFEPRVWFCLVPIVNFEFWMCSWEEAMAQAINLCLVTPTLFNSTPRYREWEGSHLNTQLCNIRNILLLDSNVSRLSWSVKVK